MSQAKFAQQVMQQFINGAARGAGAALAKQLIEEVRRVLENQPDQTDQEVYNMVFAGRLFRVSREQFFMKELPKTIEYLNEVSPAVYDQFIAQALQASNGDPEKFIVRLIQYVQQARLANLS